MSLAEIVNRIEVLIRAILGPLLLGYVKVTETFSGKHTDLSDITGSYTHAQIDEFMDTPESDPVFAHWLNSDPLGNFVVGPETATDNIVCVFDGATGKLIKVTNVTIDANGQMVINGTGTGLKVTGSEIGIEARSADVPFKAVSLVNTPTGTRRVAVLTNDTTHTTPENGFGLTLDWDFPDRRGNPAIDLTAAREQVIYTDVTASAEDSQKEWYLLHNGTLTKVMWIDGEGNLTITGYLNSLNGPSTTQVQADYTQSDTEAADYIKNKPVLPDFDTLIRRDGSVTYTGNQSMGGFSLTDLAEPEDPNDAARLIDLQNAIVGYDKRQVLVATTENITLEDLQTIDTVLLAAGDRVFVKNQTLPQENGIYLAVDEGAWTRAEDPISYKMFVLVQSGTANINTAWVLSGDQTIEVGVTPLNFIQWFGLEQGMAGDGLTKDGNTYHVGTASADRIIVNADTIDLAETEVTPDTYGDGTTKMVPVLTVDIYGRVIVASEYEIEIPITTQEFNEYITQEITNQINEQVTQDLRQFITQEINNHIGNNGANELISGADVWDSGLTFNTTELVYQIAGVTYTAAPATLTHDAADPTLARIDLHYVDTFGNVGIAKGTPAENPASPSLLADQLEIKLVLIGAGATEPTGIDNIQVYNELGEGEWAPTETHDTNTTVVFDSPDTPSSGQVRAKVNIAIPDTEVEVPLHYIGELYQGGRIFYLERGLNGTKGLIAAETDTKVSQLWSWITGYSSYVTGASDAIIGTGQANTNKMLSVDAAKHLAAQDCNDLVIGTYTDWYMPSEGELSQMRLRRNEIGGFGNKTYWSSTEITGNQDWKRARCISFATGTAYSRDKNNSYAVRAIRSFDDSAIVANIPVATYAPQDIRMVFTAEEPAGIAGTVLMLKMKSSMEWLDNTRLLIELYLESAKVGSLTLSPKSNMFGYISGQPEWQLVAIPLYMFQSEATQLDRISLVLTGSWPNNTDLGVDDVKLQNSGVTVPNSGDTYLTGMTWDSGTKTLTLTRNNKKPDLTKVLTGIDGYTPVKGVDYFDGADGQDGHTPVKGVDYFDGADGQDGHTPVKGVDYFDGQPGEDAIYSPEDVRFEFRDIEAGTAQTYDLDIDASWGYTIEGIWLETDNGTLTGVAVNIGATPVTSLTAISVDTAKDYTASTGAKTVVEHDRVTLVTSTGYTGTPTLIRGKIIVIRT